MGIEYVIAKWLPATSSSVSHQRFTPKQGTEPDCARRWYSDLRPCQIRSDCGSVPRLSWPFVILAAIILTFLIQEQVLGFDYPVSVIQPKTYTYTVWQTVNTVGNMVRDGSSLGQYNHAPTVAVDTDGSYVVLWNGNTVSGKEGADGQRIFEAMSKDGGKTWSPAREPFNDRNASENPVAPSKTQWQPVLVHVDNQLWAFWMQERFASNGGTFLSRKNPGKLWKNYRLCSYRQDIDSEGDSTGIDWCDAAVELPPDHSKFVIRDGRPWFLTAQEAITDRQGRVLVAVTAMETSKAFDSAAKRIAFLVRERGGEAWQLSPFIPQGVMGDTDPWETSLAEVEDGYLAIVRRNDIKAAVGERLASSVSKDGLSWHSMEFYDLALHRERPFIVKIGQNDHVLLMPDHESHRRNQAVFLRRFGSVFTPALPVSDEPEGYWVHYSTGAYDEANNRLLVVYSKSRKTDSGVRDILFVRIDVLPTSDRPVIIPRAFGALKRNDKRQLASFDPNGKKLKLVGSASAGIELPLPRGRLIARFDISKLVSPGPHPMVVVGTNNAHFRVDMSKRGEQGSLTSLMQISGTETVLSTRPLTGDLREVKLELEINNGLIRELGGGISTKVAGYAYFGDAFAQNQNLGPDDQLSVDISSLRFESFP